MKILKGAEKPAVIHKQIILDTGPEKEKPAGNQRHGQHQHFDELHTKPFLLFILLTLNSAGMIALIAVKVKLPATLA